MGGGNAAFGFGPDWIKTLVSMATDSSHRGLLGNVVNLLAPTFWIGSSTFLQVTRTIIKAWMNSKFGQTRPGTAELTAFERLEKSQ